MIRCAKKHMLGLCKNSRNCPEEGTEKCHQPYPPRMTNEEFDVAQTELLKDIPEEFRGTLSYMAYESGHSAGHEEVINELRGLVSDLKPAIKEFQARILRNSVATAG